MAANSLLYLLLATGLSTPPTPPSVPVTTESQFDHDYRKADQFPISWADNKDKPRSQRLDWSQVPEYKTDSTRDQYPSSRDQYSTSRDQYPSSRDQYPTSRDQYPASRDQYPESRNQFYSSRDQYSDTRDVVSELEAEYKTEDPLNQFPVTGDYDRTEQPDQMNTDWPGYADESQDVRIIWPHESEYKTEDPRDQFPVTGDDVTDRTEEADVWTAFWTEYEAKTQDPFDQFPVTGDENSEFWPLATEDPELETARSLNSAKKVHPKRSCPKQEHRSYQCDKTCSNYKKREPCPMKEKKTCICDGGYVRNNEGKCVPRSKCDAESQVARDAETIIPPFFSQVDRDSQVTWNAENKQPIFPISFGQDDKDSQVTWNTENKHPIFPISFGQDDKDSQMIRQSERYPPSWSQDNSEMF